LIVVWFNFLEFVQGSLNAWTHPAVSDTLPIYGDIAEERCCHPDGHSLKWVPLSWSGTIESMDSRAQDMIIKTGKENGMWEISKYVVLKHD